MIGFKLKILKRSFYRDKQFVVLNMLGLILAFTSILFILSWIKFEKSFDQFYENSSRIYRFTVEDANSSNQRHFARVNRPWLKNLAGYFPEVEELVRLAPGRNSSIIIGQEKFYSKEVFSTDSNFFSVFNIDLVEGAQADVLKAPRSAVINESTACKYFPNTDPIGKEIKWSHQQSVEFLSFTVTGVMPDFPVKSHFHPKILLSYDNPLEYDNWYYLYFLLKKNVEVESVESKFALFKNDFIEKAESRKMQVFHLQNVENIHLYSKKNREIESNGDAKLLLILGVVALVLLIVITLNYMNFQITSVLERHTYFNISKTFGAKWKELVSQLSVESVVQVFFSSLISVLIYMILLPSLSAWLNIDLYLSASEIGIIYFFVSLFFCLIGIICSIYSVRFLKFQGSLNRQTVFSEKGKYQSNEFVLRKGIMILQFVGGICLLIATAIIIKQNNYLLSSRIGNGQENIINLIKLPKTAVDNYKVFRQELLRNPEIFDVTASMEEPSGEVMDAFTYELEGMPEEDKSKVVYLFPIADNFNCFYNNNIIAGNDYYEDKVNSGKYLINEAALKFFGYNNPDDIIGKRFKFDFPSDGFFNEGYIAGVINDFHIANMQAQEKPMVLYNQPFFNYCVGIKFDPFKPDKAMIAIRKVWEKVNPDFCLQSYFIDDLYFELYKNQIRLRKFFSLLAGVVLLISGLGLFSLAVYNIKKRTKEIGIRKVNGARIFEMIIMLNLVFVKWIMISFVIACPVVWFLMKHWLQNFAYRTEMNWWLFGGVGFFVLCFTLIIVAFQSWKAASKNPVEALRYE